MATDTVPTTVPRPLYRFTVDQYHRLTEAGLIPEGVELMEGIIGVKGDFRDGRLKPYRFDVDQYHRMIDLGILTERTKAELIDGEVVGKMPQGNPHGIAVERLDRRLHRLLPDDCAVRCQCPITLPNSEPEPDFAVCMTEEQRGTTHPRPEHLYLVVEVADSSLIDDREGRTVLYSRSTIPVYWIVNIPEGIIEVYTDPETPPDADPHYRTRTDYAAGQDVPVVVAGTVVGHIPVAAILS